MEHPPRGLSPHLGCPRNRVNSNTDVELDEAPGVTREYGDMVDPAQEHPFSVAAVPVSMRRSGDLRARDGCVRPSLDPRVGAEVTRSEYCVTVSVSLQPRALAQPLGNFSQQTLSAGPTMNWVPFLKSRGEGGSGHMASSPASQTLIAADLNTGSPSLGANWARSAKSSVAVAPGGSKWRPNAWRDAVLLALAALPAGYIRRPTSRPVVSSAGLPFPLSFHGTPPPV